MSHSKIVYDVISHLLTGFDNIDARNEYIQRLNSNKLRDIKSKLFAKGKIGIRKEMVGGICNKIHQIIKSTQPSSMNMQQNTSKY